MIDERKVTMLAIRYLGLIAEDLSAALSKGQQVPADTARIVQCCADSIERIAQHDLVEVEVLPRMAAIQNAMFWLLEVSQNYSTFLARSNRRVPAAAEIQAIAAAAKCCGHQIDGQCSEPLDSGLTAQPL